MIAKKSSKADLERKRFAFFQIGLIVAGSLTLAAFEYSSVHEEQKVMAVHDDGIHNSLFIPVFEETIVERPEPRNNQDQAAIILEPTEEVTIVTTTINPNAIHTTQNIHVGEPCTDCYGSSFLEEGPEDGEIEEWVDTDPSFPGGEIAMAEFIRDNINTNLLSEMEVSGVAYVEFVVNTDGSICQVTTKNDVHKELKAEAERVVKKMPNWTPGEQAGKKVRVRYVIPINVISR